MVGEQRSPVRGSSAPAGQRLASTIRLPWLIGLAALLTLAAVVALLSGRDTRAAGVAHAVLDAQEAAAVGSAGQVRRSLNEGSDDLLQIARALEEDVAGRLVDPQRAFTAVAATTTWHKRYLALVVADPRDGEAVYAVPGQEVPAPFGELPRDRRLVEVLPDGRLVESVPIGADAELVVAAVYDPAFLYPDLQPRPDAVYVVDDRQRAVAAPGARGLGQPLPDPDLQEAARLAEEGIGSIVRPRGPGAATVIAHAPVSGIGPAGESGLGLLLVDQVGTTGSATSYRVSGVLAALVLALATAALFWWLHVAVVGPVLSVQRAAERVAYGDLSRPVVVDRYDEVGTIARALERLRLSLIRAQVQDVSPTADPR